MGTYDTRGGSAVSPDVSDPHIFDEEDVVLGFLEDAGVPSSVNDKVVAVVRRLCERVAALET
jgi:hypothetical protein